MTRPDRLVVVAGTGTEVGKTWVGVRLLEAARRRGVRTAARKPAQSFAVTPEGSPLEPTDADLLGAASGEAPEAVCPSHRWYPVPMAPPMAAAALDRLPFTLDDLESELAWPDRCQLGLIELAGGVRSPLAADGDCAALATRVAPDRVILVADAGLGTINAVRLSVAALGPLPVTVVLNRFDPADDLHGRNRDWLTNVDHLTVVTDAEAALDPLLAS